MFFIMVTCTDRYLKKNHHTGTILHDQSSQVNITLPNIAQANIKENLWHASPLISIPITSNFYNIVQVMQLMHNGTLRFYYCTSLYGSRIYNSTTELLKIITKIAL